MSSAAIAGAVAGEAGAGIAAATMQFVYGFIVVEPETFIKLIDERGCLVLYCRKKRFLRGTVYIYVSNYRGFYVITKSVEPIPLPSGIDAMEVKDIVLPPAVEARL